MQMNERLSVCVCVCVCVSVGLLLEQMEKVCKPPTMDFHLSVSERNSHVQNVLFR